MHPFFTNIGGFLKTIVGPVNATASSEVDGAAIQLDGPGYQYKSAQVVLYLGAATGTAGTASVALQVQQSADGSTSWTSYTDPQGNGAVTDASPATLTATAGTSAATYNSTTGLLVITISGAPLGASPGNLLGYNGTTASISGTGAGCPSLNGSFPVVSITSSGTVFTLQAPTGLVASGLSNGTLAFTSAAQQSTINVNLSGAKQFVRLAIVPTVTGSVTSIPVVGVVALGGSSENPAI